MARRVRLHVAFHEDLRQQLEWIAANRWSAYIAGLREGISEAIELLGKWPSVGTVEGHDGARVLRKLILRRVPFVIWFSVEERREGGDVWLLRLFHVRQDRVRTKRRQRKPRR